MPLAIQKCTEEARKNCYRPLAAPPSPTRSPRHGRGLCCQPAAPVGSRRGDARASSKRPLPDLLAIRGSSNHSTRPGTIAGLQASRPARSPPACLSPRVVPKGGSNAQRVERGPHFLRGRLMPPLKVTRRDAIASIPSSAAPRALGLRVIAEHNPADRPEPRMIARWHMVPWKSSTDMKLHDPSAAPARTGAASVGRGIARKGVKTAGRGPMARSPRQSAAGSAARCVPIRVPKLSASTPRPHRYQA